MQSSINGRTKGPFWSDYGAARAEWEALGHPWAPKSQTAQMTEFPKRRSRCSENTVFNVRKGARQSKGWDLTQGGKGRNGGPCATTNFNKTNRPTDQTLRNTCLVTLKGRRINHTWRGYLLWILLWLKWNCKNGKSSFLKQNAPQLLYQKLQCVVVLLAFLLHFNLIK